MLAYFEVEGFKKFEKKVILNFEDVRDYRFNTEFIKNNTIKNAIIYGKNGSGKSSLGIAVLDITAHLDDNHMPIDLYDSYLSWNIGMASFKYKFRFGKDVFEYSYSKRGVRELIQEKLMLNNKCMLDYDYETKRGVFSGFEIIQPTLNFDYQGDGSILRYILNNISLDKEHPLYKFKQFVSKMLWFRTLDENRFIGYKNKSHDFKNFIFEGNNKDEFQELLNKIGIKEKLVIITSEEDKRTLHFEKNNRFLRFFNVASSGTKALYTFFYWYKTANDASFIYLDEFDAYYHFEFSESIIEMIKKMPSTQAIVTTHNTNLLSNNIMRPDCYFVLGEKLTASCNATQRELREGHNLEKMYMAGEFDAD